MFGLSNWKRSFTARFTKISPGKGFCYGDFDTIGPADAEDSIKITGEIIELIEKTRKKLLV